MPLESSFENMRLQLRTHSVCLPQPQEVASWLNGELERPLNPESAPPQENALVNRLHQVPVLQTADDGYLSSSHGGFWNASENSPQSENSHFFQPPTVFTLESSKESFKTALNGSNWGSYGSAIQTPDRSTQTVDSYRSSSMATYERPMNSTSGTRQGYTEMTGGSFTTTPTSTGMSSPNLDS